MRIDVLRRFGYYSTESNGHLSRVRAVVPQAPRRDPQVDRPRPLDQRRDGRLPARLHRGAQLVRDRLPAAGSKEEPPRFAPENRGDEHGSYIIEALETGRLYRGHFNVVNDGCITNLPADCIVEVPGYVDRNGISIPRVGDLPLGCAAICNASVTRAAAGGARRPCAATSTLLKQAMMMDPLTGAVCNPPEIWQMTDEMLVAQARWLPQYSGEIPAARKRLASEKPLGTRGTAGAARLPTKSVEELREDKRQGKPRT